MAITQENSGPSPRTAADLIDEAKRHEEAGEHPAAQDGHLKPRARDTRAAGPAPGLGYMSPDAGQGEKITHGLKAPPRQAEVIPTWYVVRKGRSPADVGLYDSFQEVQQATAGVPDAEFQAFPIKEPDPLSWYFLPSKTLSFTRPFQGNFTLGHL